MKQGMWKYAHLNRNTLCVKVQVLIYGKIDEISCGDDYMEREWAVIKVTIDERWHQIESEPKMFTYNFHVKLFRPLTKDIFIFG